MDKSQIINQIKLHLNIKTDSEFAQFIGISQPTVSSWRKRNTLDHELIIAKCKDFNIEWLITGEGEMLSEKSGNATQFISQNDQNILTQEYGFLPDIDFIKSHLSLSETQLKNLVSSLKSSLREKIITNNNLAHIASSFLLSTDSYYKSRFETITEKEYMKRLLESYNPAKTSFDNVKLKWITLIFQFESSNEHLSYITARMARYLKSGLESWLDVGLIKLDKRLIDKVTDND